MDNDAKALTAAAIKKTGSGYRLAKILNVTQAAVSGWRNGTRHPSGPHILKLLKRAGKLAIAITIVSGTALPDLAQAVYHCILC